MKTIDQLLLEGILDPERNRFRSFYPAPIDSLLREELIACGVELTMETILKRVQWLATPEATQWFLDEHICLVEATSRPVQGIPEVKGMTFRKPYRENMYAKIDVQNKESLDWVRPKNLDAYAYRQATSCDFLRQAFTYLKLSPAEEALVDSLLWCHDRQKAQIENVLGPIAKDDQRASYYFNQLWDHIEFDPEEKPTISFWVVQALSYLRGQARYAVLKGWNTAQNARYLVNKYMDEQEVKWPDNMWAQFHTDAGQNAKLVWNYLFSSYSEAAVQTVVKDLVAFEGDLIKTIQTHV